MNKKILISLLAVLVSVFSFSAGANNDVLDRIEKANSSVKTIEAGFLHRKTIVATAKVISMKGMLYFISPDKMSMHYSVPATDLLIISDNQFHMNRGKKSSTYNTEKNAMMAGLSNTLLRCVRGQAAQVAADNDADISVKTTASDYVITLTARKKSAKGYSKIVLKYRKTDCMLVSMEMEEFVGIVNLYEMSDIKTGVNVDMALFNIPS